MGKRNKNKNQNSPSTFKTNSKVGKNKPTTPLSEGKKKALKQNVESVKQLITLPKETSTNIAKQKKQGKPPKTNESPKKSMSSDSTQSPESNGKQQLGSASNSNESKKKRKKNNKNKQHDITLSSPSNINLPIEKPLSKKARRKLKKQQQDKGDFISLKSNVNQEKKNETNKSSNITFDLSQGKNLFDSGSDEESCEDEKMEVETIPKKLKSLPSAVGKTVSANQNSGRKPQSALAKPNIIDFGSDDGEEDDEESDDSTSKLNKTKPKSSKSDTTSSSEYLSLDVSSIESCVSSVKSPRKRKSDDSSDESELEGKDIINEEADSSDESELEGKDIINDEADSSDESELEGKDFIDDEAEEGNETSGDDDSENVDHKQESPAPSPTKRRKFEPEEDTDENKVFVGGLAPNTKEEDLREALSEAGKVLSVLVPSSRDVPGECRGFAFVTLADQESLQMNSFNSGLGVATSFNLAFACPHGPQACVWNVSRRSSKARANCYIVAFFLCILDKNVLELSNNAEVNGKVIFIRKYKSDHGRGGGRGSRGRGNFRGGRGGGRGSGEGFRGGRGSGEGFRGGRGGFRGGRGGYDRDSFGGNRGGFRGGRGGNFRGGRGGFNRGSGRGSSRGSKNFF